MGEHPWETPKLVFGFAMHVLIRCVPVILFWSTRYDKAMTTFVTYLKEFAEFAYSKDQQNNIPPDKCFKLPYK